MHGADLGSGVHMHSSPASGTNFMSTGTLEDPIIVNGAGDEQYAGCTGYPVDSHQVNWLTV